MGSNRVDWDGSFIDGTDNKMPIIVQGDDFELDFTIMPSDGEPAISGANVFGSICREFNETQPIYTFDVVTTPLSSGVSCSLVIPDTITSGWAVYGKNYKDDIGELGFYEIKYTSNDVTKRVIYGKVKISRTAIIE